MKKPAQKKRKQTLSKHVLRLFFGIFVGVTVLGSLAVLLTPLCANSQSCVQDVSGEYDASAQLGTFLGSDVLVPSQLANVSQETTVLGETTSSNKRIYIDLATQTLSAKEGEATIFSFPISSGKWGKTPTGDFTIWIKLRYTRMKGGSQALGTYYNLPNVPYTMFFYNDKIPKWRGFGIHGAYWHNNFGHPMSHGCINMRVEEVEKIYNWAEPASISNTTYASAESPGTPITIYGVAPNE